MQYHMHVMKYTTIYFVLINKGDATVKLMTLTDTMGGNLTVFPDDKQMFHQLQLRVCTVLHKNLLNLTHVCGVKMNRVIFIWNVFDFSENRKLIFIVSYGMFYPFLTLQKLHNYK